MSGISLFVGADCAIQIQVKDQNGNPINLSNNVTGVTGIIIFLRDTNRNVFARFSSNAASGYGTIDNSSGASGILNFYCTRDKTQNIKTGDLLMELAVIRTDPNFPNGRKDVITDAVIGTIYPSITNTVTIP